jgi:hypothetical protein
MTHEPHRLTDLERANLVAYLDGELTEAEAQFLSTRITQSVTARREIDALQKTWDLLDFLPRPEPPPDFAGATATIALEREAGGGRLAEVASRTASIAARAAIVLGSAAAAVALGYAATRWAWPDPSARLARDLPIAEHLDEYRAVGSFEFLQRLEELPAFSEDVG